MQVAAFNGILPKEPRLFVIPRQEVSWRRSRILGHLCLRICLVQAIWGLDLGLASGSCLFNYLGFIPFSFFFLSVHADIFGLVSLLPFQILGMWDGRFHKGQLFIEQAVSQVLLV